MEVAEAKALAAAKHARMDSVDSSGDVPEDSTPARFEDGDVKGQNVEP